MKFGEESIVEYEYDDNDDDTDDDTRDVLEILSLIDTDENCRVENEELPPAG